MTKPLGHYLGNIFLLMNSVTEAEKTNVEQTEIFLQ